MEKSKIYIDKRLRHPFIDNLKKQSSFTEVCVADGDISAINGLIFTSAHPDLKVSADTRVVLCYETASEVDFSKYIEKIWWDFLDSTYFISVLNMSESHKLLGDSFNIHHNLIDVPLFGSDAESTLSLANAYSYCTTKKSSSILYSVITSASYRKKVYNFFETKCFNVPEDSIYDISVIDEYTYSMINLPYLTKTSFDLKEALTKLIPLISSFSKYSREDIGDPKASLVVLDDHFSRYFKYIDETESYSEEDLDSLKIFYDEHKLEILSLQSFAQNNNNLSRCVIYEDKILYDYFSIYSAKEHYSSYLMDFGQLFISIHQQHGSKLTIPALQDIVFYRNLLPKKYLKFIYFFALLEGESIKNKTIYRNIMSMFNREL